MSVLMRAGAKPCFFRSFRSNRLADLAHRLVRDIDATPGQQLLDITKRQREPRIEPDRMLNDFGRKTMALEGYWGHGFTVAATIPGDHPVNVSMPRRAVQAGNRSG